MKPSLLKLFWALLGVMLLSSCTLVGTGDTQSIPSPTGMEAMEAACGAIDLPPSQVVLATPYALEPAAGICAGPFDGDTATIEIWPDMPDPRCLLVTAEQRLQVVNQTGENIQVQLGQVEGTVVAVETYTLDCPLGSYLEPGVHQLLASPFGGPEIWLKSDSE